MSMSTIRNDTGLQGIEKPSAITFRPTTTLVPRWFVLRASRFLCDGRTEFNISVLGLWHTYYFTKLWMNFGQRLTKTFAGNSGKLGSLGTQLLFLSRGEKMKKTITVMLSLLWWDQGQKLTHKPWPGKRLSQGCLQRSGYFAKNRLS
jgi:hypothetical protein